MIERITVFFQSHQIQKRRIAMSKGNGDVGPLPPGSDRDSKKYGGLMTSNSLKAIVNQMGEWKFFYEREFGLEFNSPVDIPPIERRFGELMLINNKIPIQQIVEKFKEPVMVYRPKFIEPVIDTRTSSDWYVAYVQLSQIRTGREGVTLREHLLRSLKFCFEGECEQLDKRTTTVCTGSPFAQGGFPHISVYGEKLVVDKMDIFDDNNFRYFGVST
jgi:hypothetical protein